MPQSGGADPLIHFDRYDVETKGLEHGIHTLYARVMDENGVWSDVQSAAVEIRQPEGGRVTLPGHPAGFREPPGLVAAEYFYGDDPGTGNAISLDLGDLQGWPSILGDVSITAPGEEGVKILGLRVQDADGEWSDTRQTVVAAYDPDYFNEYIVTPSALEGGSIEPASPQTVQHNHSLAFTITPDEGYLIDTVTGCEGTLADTVYTTGEITEDCTVQVSFALKQYQVSPPSQPLQGGTLEGTGTYDHGSSVTVTARPDNGYHFVKWHDGVATNPRIYENITEDINVSAVFAINQYKVTVGSSEGGSTDKDGEHTIDHGGSITLSASPDQGYHFTGWGGDASGADNPLTVSDITAERTITATFERNQYAVRFLDHDGTELKSETVLHGSGATAPPEPEREGHAFTGWDKAFASITEDFTVTARYDRLTYQVTYTAGDNGTITGPTPQTVNHGECSEEVIAQPDTGFLFSQWSDGSKENPRQDKNVTENIAVSAVFDILKGDVNQDGRVDIQDAMLLIQYSAGMAELTDMQKKAGNISGHVDDNDVGLADVVKIIGIMAGK